jgi:hypothetical protein
LELEGKSRERVESFKLLRVWLELDSASFPKSLTNSLVAISESESDEFKKMAVEALRTLSIENPVVVVWSGGMRTLVTALLDINTPQALSENIVFTFCYLLNEGNSRTAIKEGAEILKIFAVFTDSSPSVSEKDLEILINLARRHLVLMSRSWAGLIFLTSNGMQALISTLVRPGKAGVKEGILDTLLEILGISVDLQSRCFDLMINYLAILIQALLHCGLFKALISLSVDPNVRILQRARKLLKIITVLGPKLLPNCPICPVHLGINTEGKAAELVADMDSSCRIKKDRNEESLLTSSIHFISSENPGATTPPSSLLSRIYQKHLCDSMDDSIFFSTVYKTQSISKDPNKWEWEAIYELLSGPLSSGSRLTDSRTQKFLKSLLVYFTASKGLFTNLEWEPKNFLRAKIGGTLIKFLLSTKSKHLLVKDYQESFFVVRKPFLREMIDLIEEELKESPSNEGRVLSPENLRTTMTREYLKWLGLFINTRAGRKLLRPFNLTSKLEKLSEVSHLSLVLLTVLDYRERICQHFLNFCLQARSKIVKIKAIQQIQVIFRAGMQDLRWAIDELPTLLFIHDEDILKSALNVINEICQYKGNLDKLVETRPPNLLKIKDKSIYLKILTTDAGFDFLEELDLINSEIHAWDRDGNVEYARDVESKMVKSLQNQKKMFALTLRPPKIFQNHEKQEISWISNLSFIVAVKCGDKIFEFDSALEVYKEETFITCYTSNFLCSSSEYIAASLKIAGNFINFQGNQTTHPFWIMCKLDPDSEISENDGVFFTFSSTKDLKLESVRFRVLVLPQGSSAVHPPGHFFGELSKTRKGFQKLIETGLIEKYGKGILEENQVAQRRAWLWALGHVGASEDGTCYLLQKDILKNILKIAEKSETLSLRGTAFQVISLIARTNCGRIELAKRGWVCNEGDFLNVVAVPCIPQRFFHIEGKEQKIYHPLCRNLEDVVESVSLDLQEKQVLEHICRLGTVVDKSESENFLRTVRITSPKVFQNLKLFHVVSVILSGYSFKLQTRRVIHKLLERVYRVDNFGELDMFRYQ